RSYRRKVMTVAVLRKDIAPELVAAKEELTLAVKKELAPAVNMLILYGFFGMVKVNGILLSSLWQRLVVAVLMRGHSFGTLDAVKEELAHAAKMLIPVIAILSSSGYGGSGPKVGNTASALDAAKEELAHTVKMFIHFGTLDAVKKELAHAAKMLIPVIAIFWSSGEDTALALVAVKGELAHAVKMLILYGFSGMQRLMVAVLRKGHSFGILGFELDGGENRREPSSNFYRGYIVEDVDVEAHTHRRLIFLDNQFLVQSEARLKEVRKKNITKLVVDFGHMSLYHTFICAGVEFRRGNLTKRAGCSTRLGGGGLCMFLRKCYEDVEITAVDIDPEMLNVAKEYFQLVTDDRLEVQIKDGMDFLKYEADAGMLWIPKVLGKFYEKKKTR
ncbi:hypothetical protein evm_015231, partial [Chilo suppressalis]